MPGRFLLGVQQMSGRKRAEMWLDVDKMQPSMFLWVEVGFHLIPHFVPGIKANFVSMTFHLFRLFHVVLFLQTCLASKVRNKWAHMEGRTGQDVPRSQAVNKPLVDTPASWCPGWKTTRRFDFCGCCRHWSFIYGWNLDLGALSPPHLHLDSQVVQERFGIKIPKSYPLDAGPLNEIVVCFARLSWALCVALDTAAESAYWYPSLSLKVPCCESSTFYSHNMSLMTFR